MSEKENKTSSPAAREASRTRSIITGDIWFYRIALIALSLVAVGGLISTVALSVMGKTQPELVSNLSSAAMGALAGLLAGVRQH